MDFALAAVTILSLTLTVAMAVVTWRLVREERRRSAARIAALAAELERSRAPEAAAPGPPTRQPRWGGLPGPPAPQPRWGGTSEFASREAAARRAGEGTTYRASSELFARPTADGRWSRLAGAIGMAGFVVAAVVTMVILAFPKSERTAEPLAAPEARAAARPSQPAPLELVALGHEPSGEMLSIFGLIRHPGSGRELRNLFVMAMAFDRNGAMIASGRSPLDRVTDGNDELRFTVAIPARGVSRYRISFLDGTSTVPHIDRRAAPVAPTRSASLSKRIGDHP